MIVRFVLPRRRLGPLWHRWAGAARAKKGEASLCLVDAPTVGVPWTGGDWPADLGPPLRCGTLGAHVEQPAPLPGAGDVWQEVIDAETQPGLRALYVERRAIGLERYGTPLQRGNARDHLRDALEEALDLMAYLMAANVGAGVDVARTLALHIHAAMVSRDRRDRGEAP